jgi:hypothetical protein
MEQYNSTQFDQRLFEGYQYQMKKVPTIGHYLLYVEKERSL